MNNFTLLKYEQCTRLSNKFLEVFEKIGTSEAELTDFAKLFNDTARNRSTYWTRDICRKTRSSEAQTENELENTAKRGAYITDGKIGSTASGDCHFGIRIALPYTSKISHNEGSTIEELNDDLSLAEYGYYPQKATPEDVQEILKKHIKKVQ